MFTFVPRKCRKGFTLLELVIVLTLLSIVAAFAAPRLTGFLHGRHVNEEARRMLCLTQYARAEAINRGVRVTVWFNPADSTYGAESDATDPQDNPIDLNYKCPDGLSIKVDADALGKDGRATILFWPDGSIDADSVDRVELWEGDKPYLMMVRQETGMEYSLEAWQDENAK